MGNSRNSTTEQFKEKLKLKNPNLEVLGEYVNNATKILVRDKQCGHEWDTSIPNSLLLGGRCPQCSKIREGENRRNKGKNKIGETVTLYNGEVAELIDYTNNKKVLIKIQSTNEIIECTYDHFTKGKVRSHFTTTVFNIGILGMEKTRDNDNKLINSYAHWSHMLERCYDQNQQERHERYKDVTVCDEWLFYPNFKKWYDDNCYEIEGEQMHLDKDILFKGNKVYSPDTCLIVPQRINGLFVKRDKLRGNLPIGVHCDKRKYCASCSIINLSTNKPISKRLGLYNSPEEAFYKGYKPFKEKYIKEVADQYKEQISDKLYNAMYNYIVEITD